MARIDKLPEVGSFDGELLGDREGIFVGADYVEWCIANRIDTNITCTWIF